MYIIRLLENAIKKAEKSFPAVVITGPRQSGKSTLLEEFLKNKDPGIIKLDDPQQRALLLDDPYSYLKSIKKPCIIDEIQYYPEVSNYIKILIDEDRMPGQWYITGSQQFSVMKNISESLAGRAAILGLPTFSIMESNITDLEKWLLNSSYPEIITNPKVDSEIWYSSYLQTYLDRDVKMILDIGNLRDFEQCLRLLAARTGQVLNYSEISGSIGVSVNTIKKWVSVLEASYILFLLPPYFNNYGKRITKAPKIYFYDLGLVNYLVGIKNITFLLNGPMAGAIYETAVISEILKQKYALGKKPELYYWRSQSGIEVDLLLSHDGKIIPIEIKLSSTIKPQFYKNLKYWLELSNSEEIACLITNCNKNILLPGFVKNIYWANIEF